ncbi:TPA: hypothetical protein ACGVAU_004287 [Vibrio vulnificus]|uniref:hypothetical protein n=1 Tax=Vibrio TaxID=662 RepID=UPI0011210F9A|nr:MULTISPECIES: hypothetical protein [Vibrio]EHU8077675.1 hypothetical protein [Vibrio cholerae]HDY7868859.1 hypothetical protein [Vibrio vulnificus]EHV9953731.1 hypothetical protein [Vibrio cholerae]MDA0115527.1 hypothetical protein [Vibrio sp. 2art]MDI7855098.1 hypothetical protein [Vibrio parahaemolyticus]
MTKKHEPFSVAIQATEKALATAQKKLDQVKADFELYLDFQRRAELLGNLAFEIGRLEVEVEMGKPAQRKKAETDLKAKQREYNRLANFDMDKNWQKEQECEDKVRHLTGELNQLKHLKQRDHRYLFA